MFLGQANDSESGHVEFNSKGLTAAAECTCNPININSVRVSFFCDSEFNFDSQACQLGHSLHASFVHQMKTKKSNDQP